MRIVSLVFGGLAVVSICAVAVRGGVQIIQRGADARASDRLRAAGTISVALVFILALPAALIGVGTPLAVVVASLIGFALVARLGAAILARREHRDAKRVYAAVGLPATPRIWSPWAVSGVWFLVALAIPIAAAYLIDWVHPPRTHAATTLVAGVLLGVLIALVFAGCLHTAYQWVRRR